MAHDRTNRTASLWLLFTLASQTVAHPSCTGAATARRSEWPPRDFLLIVEELHDEEHRGIQVPVVRRRYEVGADGICIYASASDVLWIEASDAPLPVFSRLCIYRLVEPSTRLLARKLDKRGVMDLRDAQGDQRETQGLSLRLRCRMFGREKEVRGSGQIHGEFARVLHLVNAHVPAGEAFLLPGMAGDAEPSPLRGVPAPAEGLAGAYTAMLALDGERASQPEHLLHLFALAVRSGDRDGAEEMLARWTEASGYRDHPLADVRLTPEALRTLLPP